MVGIPFILVNSDIESASDVTAAFRSLYLGRRKRKKTARSRSRIPARQILSAAEVSGLPSLP